MVDAGGAAPAAGAPAAPAAADPNLPAAGAAPEAKKPDAENPFEFELDVKGSKQKLNFKDKQQLTAVLQKALYADQVIKDASQAKKGAEALMEKLKSPQGLREILSDPAIGQDYKKFALGIVQEMMEDEALSPEQRRLRDLESENKGYKDRESKAKADADAAAQAKKNAEQLVEIRSEIIGAMEKFPDIPKTQATVDAVIQNMRAGFKRYGKHLTPDQAMTVYATQYWQSFLTTFSKMTDEQIVTRLGDKTGEAVIARLNKLNLAELRKRTDPNGRNGPAIPPKGADNKPKKNMTEKEFEKHFSQLAGL